VFVKVYRWMTVIILAAHGAWGLLNSWYAHAWIPAIVPTASAAAAVGVALHKAWSRILVLMLAALFVGTWTFSLWLAFEAGAFRGWSARKIVVSALPGAFFSSLAIFCCFVVVARWRAPPGQTNGKT
jgi:hypothetical protein